MHWSLCFISTPRPFLAYTTPRHSRSYRVPPPLSLIVPPTSRPPVVVVDSSIGCLVCWLVSCENVPILICYEFSSCCAVFARPTAATDHNWPSRGGPLARREDNDPHTRTHTLIKSRKSQFSEHTLINTHRARGAIDQLWYWEGDL